jgi:hypothetical protein
MIRPAFSRRHICACGEGCRTTSLRLSASAVMVAVGRELRAMYSDIVAERVPDRFAEILCRLDELSGDGARQEEMSRGRDKTGRLCKKPPSLLGACARCRCFSVPSFGRGSCGDVVELVALAELSDGAGMVGVEVAGASEKCCSMLL